MKINCEEGIWCSSKNKINIQCRKKSNKNSVVFSYCLCTFMKQSGCLEKIVAGKVELQFLRISIFV